MELEYTGIIQTDSMMLMAVRQNGEGPYQTTMTVPGMSKDYSADKQLTCLSYTSGGESKKLDVALDAIPGQYGKMTMHHEVAVSAYEPSGKMKGPVHGTVDITTDLEADAASLYTLDLMPVRDYATSLVGPDKDVPPITAYSVEGQFPDEVVDAYESFLADKNEATLEEFARQSMLHDEKITASSVHIEWEELGDVSPIGFGPRPEQ
ncbi:MAG: hypothetical protein QF415_16600 [Candidatus Undinarchaeales archaeon]|jgi:hypothetical protein|nr:hypothetical protein [Candidatus Undinarchaeales archaeon]MDP7494673.1 hypothetical protein [Candidatus Undinarchaeales archaeon]